MDIALITDTHLSGRAPECVANWHAAAAAVAAAEPDLTIHLGDITLDGVNGPGELAFAATLIRAWPTPVRCLVGNHDMGTASGEEPLSASAYGRCLDAFGPDRWRVRADGWTLLGINAQLLGSGSVQERSQQQWLQTIAGELTDSDRVALFLHRPVKRPPDDDSMPRGRYVGPEAARWLLDGPLGDSLRVVVSGHTHQALSFAADGIQHLWIPSSSFVFSDEIQKPVGKKVVGMGWLHLDDGELYCMTVVPPGCQPHELTQLAFYRQAAAHH